MERLEPTPTAAFLPSKLRYHGVAVRAAEAAGATPMRVACIRARSTAVALMLLVGCSSIRDAGMVQRYEVLVAHALREWPPQDDGEPVCVRVDVREAGGSLPSDSLRRLERLTGRALTAQCPRGSGLCRVFAHSRDPDCSRLRLFRCSCKSGEPARR